MKEIRSTVHIVTEELDQGAPIIVSGPVEVELPGGISPEEVRGTEALGRLSEQHREALRKMDSVIYPMALELMSSGRVYVDDNGSVCADENALSAIKSMGMKTCGVKAYLPQVVEDG
jgi:folate-dependent phosphoribosylglycinamide formyltransferase PurN